MDQHPIPRQITTFEFKLIGFLTIKQFLYLAVSIPLAYVVIQVFPIPLLNVVLGFAVGAIGVVTAFVPIKDRTLDVWAKNIWKRLQNPTQYYYKKDNDPLYFLKELYFLADPHHMLAHIESKEKLSQYLALTKQRPKADYRKKQVGALLHTPTDVLQSSSAPVVPSDHAPAATVTPPTPAQQLAQTGTPPTPPIAAEKPTNPFAGLAGAAATVKESTLPSALPPMPPPPHHGTIPSVPEEAVITTPPAPIPTQVIPMPKPPQQITPPAQPIVQPVVIPPTPVAAPTSTAPVMKVEVQPATTIQQPVQPITVQSPVQASAPPTQPFFVGIVRNNKQIPLPGILVYIKDAAGTPLRILKTNPHGVFATFNPIPLGEYLFEIKDPNGTYFFDTMKQSVKQTNPLPFEFQSKEIL